MMAKMFKLFCIFYGHPFSVVCGIELSSLFELIFCAVLKKVEIFREGNCMC